jgi:hypothetical protein
MSVLHFKLLQLGSGLTADILGFVKCTPFYLHTVCSSKLAVNTGIGTGLGRNVVHPNALSQAP